MSGDHDDAVVSFVVTMWLGSRFVSSAAIDEESDV